MSVERLAVPSVAAPAVSRWSSLTAVMPVLLQLLLAAAVVLVYDIENTRFQQLFLLAVAGFAVNAALATAYRLPFFVLLSMAGVFVVFGAVDGLWLIAAGGVMIGLANLPLRFGARAGVLLAVGAVLALARGGLLPSPWSAMVWPILGSMFMFRIVLYLWTIENEPAKDRVWWALAYFFMLPNLVFPLFPVVDYQTFRRTYYDKPEAGIYDQGLLWIARGLVHLVLYRFIYQSVIGDPESVVTLGDLVKFMLATLLLYLRVSGQFHLIVGVLHLFGFRLPETHKLYLLSHSFTELWRRINIYWTDFMMKTVFYPTYFKVKQRGAKAALVFSTIVVFVTTWLLHSYQWFWLRGGFPFTPQDIFFWAILGALVVYGGLRELKAAKKPRSTQAFNGRSGLKAATTFLIFCALWSLWSAESLATWLWMLSAVVNVDTKGVTLLAGSFAIVFLLGSVEWNATRGGQGTWAEKLTRPGVRSVAPMLLLLVVAQPATQAAMPREAADSLRALQTSKLNARDLSLQHRGYYEQLDVRAQLDTPVNADGRKRDASWQTLDQLGVLNDRPDLMLRDLRPLRATTWNGKQFSTNEWGMRDQSYTLAKAPGTFRIAILGPSHVMGNNVADNEVFERLVEQQLNAGSAHGSYQRYEILNFGVDGYSLPQQVALLQDRVFEFAPDMVIATHYVDNANMTEGLLVRVAERGIPVPDPGLNQVIAGSGLLGAGVHGPAVPYAGMRAALASLGMDTRMPYGEARSRARRVADAVLAVSFKQFAEDVRKHGAVPIVLALNVVLDEVPREIPLRSAIESAGLPMLDLFGVYVNELAALRVAPWDDHPNAAGHRLIADRLYKELTPYITSGAVERTRTATASN